MDSPVFTYSPGWQTGPAGADPSEPAAPWQEPSGSLEFEYFGQRLDLLLALGNFWGYLYVTVDGRPANQLAAIPGNRTSQAAIAGYRTLYAPELHTENGPTSQWITVHEAGRGSKPHRVEIEIWRSWDQIPLRAVAIDVPRSTAIPIWPGLSLLLFGLLGTFYVQSRPPSLLQNLVYRIDQSSRPTRVFLARFVLRLPCTISVTLALLSVAVIASAILQDSWWQACIGLASVAYLSIRRPALWTALIFFSLPFYFAATIPILPDRAFGLVDIGIAGGVWIQVAHWFLTTGRIVPRAGSTSAIRLLYTSTWLPWSLAAVCVWALVSATHAHYANLALYEWRVVFFYGFLLSLQVKYAITHSWSGGPVKENSLWVIVLGWQLGATAVALLGLWHYASGLMLISAEGVDRIRALYGSPNNLALYLERSLAVAMSLALLLPRSSRMRWIWIAMALLQMLGLLLTFSKGAILLGIPAILVTLATAATTLAKGQPRARHALVGVAGLIVLMLAVLAPFLGTERFQRLLDLSQGTGYLRVQLWRSSLQMALDNLWLGVGPDNFLYTFRSVYLLPSAWQEPDLNHPHNWILDWWTRLGLPGLFMGAVIFLQGIRSLVRAVRSTVTEAPMLAALYVGMLAATAGALTHGLIDASYALPDLLFTWILLFGLVVTARSEQSPQRG